MKNELSDKQNAAILKALEEAIETGPWDDSNFLKLIGRNLRDIRDKFNNQVNAPEHEKVQLETKLRNKEAAWVGQQQIFVALYSADGNNLSSWERILTNLPRQMISRPIYSNEEDIQAIIRTKENKSNEAYVAIYVKQSDILTLSVDKTPVDKLGKSLLSLKDKALVLDNIVRFIHLKSTYRYHYGKLIKDKSPEPS